MNITFDPAKDAANIANHGVSLAAAHDIEWNTLYAVEDARKTYGETRIIGLAYIDLRLHCVVFTERGAERRIISLRKANQREVNRYAQT